MGAYLFLQGKGHLSLQVADAARKVGATLINFTYARCTCGHGCRPGKCPESQRHWFEGPDMGEPFNSELAAKVVRILGG